MMDGSPSTPGKSKMEKPPHHSHHFYHHPSTARLLLRWHHSSPLSKFAFWAFLTVAVFAILFLLSPGPPSAETDSPPSSSLGGAAGGSGGRHRRSLRTASWGGPAWEKRVRSSARIRRQPGGLSVLVTGAAGFVGTHVSAALKKRGDGVLGLDSFNDYYDPSLNRARQALLERVGVFVVEGDVNDALLLRKLFDVVPFVLSGLFALSVLFALPLLCVVYLLSLV